MPILSFRTPQHVLVLLAALFCWSRATVVAAQGASENEVKAAFLFNFAKYVEWPGTAFAESDRIVVGVLGDDEFAGTVEKAIAGKTAGGHPIVVEKVAPAGALPPCHVLYIGRSESERLAALLASAAKDPILSIGDSDGFVERGGIIGFTMQDNKLRFSVNAGAAEKVGLKISSQLTKLALRVVP